MSRTRASAKAAGTRWESSIVAWLIDNGWPHAERRRLSGRYDRGDIAGVAGVCIEAKDAASFTPGPWLNEALTERDNAGAAIGVVWAKRRGKASPGDGFVVMDGATFTALLKGAGYQ